MSFFISSMPLDGLMSRPPVSKQIPLPTSVTCARLRGPRRDRSAAAPAGWRGRRHGSSESFGEQLVADGDCMRAPCRAAIARGRLDLGRAQVVGRRVDQVAGESHGLDGVLPKLRSAPSGRRRVTARGWSCSCSARSDTSRGPGDRRERRVVRVAGQPITAARKRLRQLPDQELGRPRRLTRKPSPKPKSAPATRPSGPGATSAAWRCP